MAAFSYRHSVAPMLWALIAVAIGEACLVHLLVALLWSRWAALALSAATLATILWLVALTRSFATLPVTVDADEVTMRAGSLRSIRFARDDVAAVDREVSAAALRRRGVMKLSLLAHPNIVVRLKAPVPVGRRRIDSVVHRLDDPAAFAAALGR